MKLPVMSLCLALAALAVTCMGQTFQYSHGWEVGKRAPMGAAWPDWFELQDEAKLERCLQQLQQYVRRPLVFRSSPFGGALPLSSATSNNNNNLFKKHHQSNEVYDEGAESTEFQKKLN